MCTIRIYEEQRLIRAEEKRNTFYIKFANFHFDIINHFFLDKKNKICLDVFVVQKKN